jgi:CubicO group peptidase (beta-lactamase class C family)
MRTTTRILALVLVAAASSPAVLSREVDLERLDVYIRNAMSEYELTGLAVSIVKDHEVVFSKGYGVRNAETGEPVTPDSLFNIASCSKAFTAAAVAMVVEDGDLRWDEKVVDHVPGFQLADPYITRELDVTDTLSHRTGLGTFYGDLLWYNTDYDNREIIRRMRHLPITNDFRSEFGYQNNMYMIAGEIIHEVTGKSWSEFTKERIFVPLGMTRSRTHGGALADMQEIAMPHLEGRLHEPSFDRPHPAGSIFSSARELTSWIRMLLNDGSFNGTQLMKPETVEELFSAKTVMRVSKALKRQGVHFRAYGLGWGLQDYAGRKVAAHGGGMPGYISQVVVVPEENLGFVLLSNDMNLLVRALRGKILDLFLKGGDTDWAAEFLYLQKQRKEKMRADAAERRKNRAEGTRPSLDLVRYAGLYRDKMYGDARVELASDALRLTLLPTRDWFVSPMEHWHHDTFRIEFKDPFLPEGFVTFELNSKGEVTGFKIDLPNPDFHFFNLDFERIDETAAAGDS